MDVCQLVPAEMLDNSAPQTRELSTEIWRILKTLLFSHLLISQTILSSIPYIKSPAQATHEPSSSSISRSVIRCLDHLSFVLSQFGGVTSSAEGFKEIKRVFYMALDILEADEDPQTNDNFVKELISGARGTSEHDAPNWLILQQTRK